MASIATRLEADFLVNRGNSGWGAHRPEGELSDALSLGEDDFLLDKANKIFKYSELHSFCFLVQGSRSEVVGSNLAYKVLSQQIMKAF